MNEIMAMAVLDLFPGVVLGEGKVTSTQFSYRFQFPTPLHPDLTVLVTEKMRAILKNCPLVEVVEMAVSAAENYFLHHDQPFKAEMVLNEDVLILLVRIGNFYDLILAPPYQGDLHSVAFQLFEWKQEGEWTEISGTAFESKEELKKFIKKRKQWLKEKPWEEAERLELVFNDVLLPEGVKVYRKLENFWRDRMKKKGALEIFGNCIVAAQHLKKEVAMWGGEDGDCAVIFPASLDACISSLQFIDQSFKMLELDAKWVLLGETTLLVQALRESGISYSLGNETRENPTVELKIFDTLGELEPGPFLSIRKDNRGNAYISYSLLGPVKRLIALIAEWKILMGEKEKFES